MITTPNPDGRPIMLVSRNSGQQGSKARRLAATECHATAQDLFDHTGIDVRHLIPPVADLIEMLRSRAVRKASQDSKSGKKFVNEYLTLHLAEHVILLVSTGSGRKIDIDLTQPFLDWLNSELKSLRPGLLVWHRIDRVFRTHLLGANTLHLCEELAVKIVDGEKGLFNGDFAAIMALLRARESSEEASRIPKKTRAGQISRTGTDMSTGSVPYGVAQAAPAGLMVVRMKAPNGQLGENRLFFDTPACHPAAGDVAYGLPDVRLNGHRVDQVANVRFVLARLGRPGWTINAVARALVERGFSTHRLRMEHTPQTAFTAAQVRGEVHRVLRPILSRLDFYRTGELPVRLGVEGIKDITIVNCFPPDGPWAAVEDFDRVDAYLRSTKGGGPATQGLTGVVVSTEEGSLPLRSAPSGRRPCGPSYVTKPSERGGRRRANGLPAIPHSALAESIVEGLVAHAAQLLTPLVQEELPEGLPRVELTPDL